MTSILQSLPQLAAALNNNQVVICNKEGEWRVPNLPTRFVRKLVLKKKEEDSILLAFHKTLVEAETFKLFFNAAPEVMEKQSEFYKNLIRTGQAVIKYHKKAKSNDVKNLCNSLELAIIKLQYRIQIENGGFNPIAPKEIKKETIEKIQNRIEEFQKKDEKYQHTQRLNFNAQILEICQYPEIVKFLLDPKNTVQTDEYLQRSIRDNFSVEVLNQYHYESKALSDNFIACRTGAIARKLVSVDLMPLENGAFVKTLNLLMENKKVNLLDKHQKISFSNGLEWTLARIYKDFREKNDNPGDLEILRDGVVPFNGHQLAGRVVPKKKFWHRFKILRFLFNVKKKYESIDTTQPEWYEKTKVLDIRSKEYIESRYNVKIQNDKQWVTVLEATRRHELDVDKAHGYSLFYQPIGNNQYRVYSFGAFPWKFPQTSAELVDFAANTVPGTIAFDPNYFYSQSQKASWPLVVEENVAKALLTELGMQRKNGIIFQLGWENCAYFMRRIFAKVLAQMNVPVTVPNFFQKKFKNAQPRGPLLVVQKLFNSTTERLLPIVKLILALFFRATRSIKVVEDGVKIKKSLYESPFFRELKINVPSAMHYRIKKDRNNKLKNPAHEEKFASCVLNYGHTPPKEVAAAR